MKNLHVKKLTTVVLFFLTLGTITTTNAQDIKYSWVAVDLNTCTLWDDSNHDLIDLGLTASWMKDFDEHLSLGLVSGVYSRHGSFEIPLGVDVRYNLFNQMKVNPFVGVKLAALVEAMPEGTRNDMVNTLLIGSIGARINKKALIGLDLNYWHLVDFLERRHHSDAPFLALRLGWEF